MYRKNLKRDHLNKPVPKTRRSRMPSPWAMIAAQIEIPKGFNLRRYDYSFLPSQPWIIKPSCAPGSYSKMCIKLIDHHNRRAPATLSKTYKILPSFSTQCLTQRANTVPKAIPAIVTPPTPPLDLLAAAALMTGRIKPSGAGNVLVFRVSSLSRFPHRLTDRTSANATRVPCPTSTISSVLAASIFMPKSAATPTS